LDKLDKPKKIATNLLQVAAPLLDVAESEEVILPAGQSYSTSNANTSFVMQTWFHTSASIALPYHPSPQHSAELVKGLNKSQYASALSLFPSLCLILTLLAMFEVGAWAVVHCHLPPFLFFLPMALGGSATWKLCWAIEKLLIVQSRTERSKGYEQIPDQIMLTADGIRSTWSGFDRRFTSSTLRWSKIRLVYLEKAADDEGHFICIRNSAGGLFRLHSSGFACPQQEDFFLDTLRKKVPAAIKEAPLYLAVQPEQATPMTYQWRWDWLYWKRWLAAATAIGADPMARNACLPVDAAMLANTSLPGGGAAPIRLQNGRYTLREKLRTNFDATFYLAEAIDPEVGNRSYCTLASERKQEQSFGAQRVLVKKYTLPPLMMHPDDHHELLAWLEAEMRLASRLDNKRILRWLDVFVEGTSAYAVFEYFEGRTLKEWVQVNGPFKEKEALSVALQLCEIVGTLHKLTPLVVHKSLDSDSFVINNEGLVKLTCLPKERLASKALGGFFGKPGYIAPENFRGAPCKQSDIYSIGSILHLMLTGTEPQPLQRSEPQTLNHEISETLNAAVARATEPELAKRFENVDLMKRMLIQSEAEHLITRLTS